MQTPVTSCHLIPRWHVWNTNTNDIMMTWFTLFLSFAHMHGACALYKYVASKYLSGLACMQAVLNLGKLSASYFWVLNTQNANENIPDMIPIAYLNENLMYCNENIAWAKWNPSFIPTYCGTQKSENEAKTSFYFISCRYHNF